MSTQPEPHTSLRSCRDPVVVASDRNACGGGEEAQLSPAADGASPAAVGGREAQLSRAADGASPAAIGGDEAQLSRAADGASPAAFGVAQRSRSAFGTTSAASGGNASCPPVSIAVGAPAAASGGSTARRLRWTLLLGVLLTACASNGDRDAAVGVTDAGSGMGPAASAAASGKAGHAGSSGGAAAPSSGAGHAAAAGAPAISSALGRCIDDHAVALEPATSTRALAHTIAAIAAQCAPSDDELEILAQMLGRGL